MVGNEAAILDNDFIDMESHVEDNRTTKQKESISLLKQSNWYPVKNGPVKISQYLLNSVLTSSFLTFVHCASNFSLIYANY